MLLMLLSVLLPLTAAVLLLTRRHKAGRTPLRAVRVLPLALALSVALAGCAALAESGASGSPSGSEPSGPLPQEARFIARVRVERRTEAGFDGTLLDSDDPGLAPDAAVTVEIGNDVPVSFNILEGVVYEVEFRETQGSALRALAVRPSDDHTGASDASAPDSSAPEPAGTSAGLRGELYGSLDAASAPERVFPGTDAERDEWVGRLEQTEGAALVRTEYPYALGAQGLPLPEGYAEKLWELTLDGLRRGGDESALPGKQSWALEVCAADGSARWSARYDAGELTLWLPGRDGVSFSADAVCMNEAAELLWQANQAAGNGPAPEVAYRLLINEPSAFSRYTVTERQAADAAALSEWKDEWRARILDGSMTSVLYATTPDGSPREGSAEEIRALLDYAAESVAGVYTGDPWDANDDPLLQIAAEGADGSVLWNLTWNGRYILFSPDGKTGYCFTATAAAAKGPLL